MKRNVCKHKGNTLPAYEDLTSEIKDIIHHIMDSIESDTVPWDIRLNPAITKIPKWVVIKKGVSFKEYDSDGDVTTTYKVIDIHLTQALLPMEYKVGWYKEMYHTYRNQLNDFHKEVVSLTEKY